VCGVCENSIHPFLQERIMESDGLTLSTNKAKCNKCGYFNELQIFVRIVFNRSMQGRDSCRIDPDASIQQQKYAVYYTSPLLKSGTVFADCNKWDFSISFSEEVVYLTFFCT